MPVTHAKTNAITDWTQADLNQAIAAGRFPPGTLLSQIVLPSDWNHGHTVSIDVSELSATGVKDATTFLRGDNTFAVPAGGGGGTETGQILTSGDLIIASVTPGAPKNVIVRKGVGAATAITLPAPNAGSPWGRVNIKDGNGDAFTNNITVTPASGLVDGAANFVINTNYQGQSFLDDGTAWNIQN